MLIVCWYVVVDLIVVLLCPWCVLVVGCEWLALLYGVPFVALFLSPDLIIVESPVYLDT